MLIKNLLQKKKGILLGGGLSVVGTASLYTFYIKQEAPSIARAVKKTIPKPPVVGFCMDYLIMMTQEWDGILKSWEDAMNDNDLNKSLNIIKLFHNKIFQEYGGRFCYENIVILLNADFEGKDVEKINFLDEVQKEELEYFLNSAKKLDHSGAHKFITIDNTCRYLYGKLHEMHMRYVADQEKFLVDKKFSLSEKLNIKIDNNIFYLLDVFCVFYPELKNQWEEVKNTYFSEKNEKMKIEYEKYLNYGETAISYEKDEGVKIDKSARILLHRFKKEYEMSAIYLRKN